MADVWVVSFRDLLNLLYFSLMIARADGQLRRVHFDPVSLTDSCVVCGKGHPAFKCDLFETVDPTMFGLPEGRKLLLKQMPLMI